jgi:hypothetical protein
MTRRLRLLRTSSGALYPRHFLRRLLSRLIALASVAADTLVMSPRFGGCRRSNPWLYSQVPFCLMGKGLAKQAAMPLLSKFPKLKPV